MVEVITKNTFISFAITSEQSEFADSSPHYHGSPRSRSAESFRNKQVAAVQENIMHQSMQRLNAVLSVGISGGASLHHENESNEFGCSQVGGIVHLSELTGLKEKLGRALASNPLPSEVEFQSNDSKLKQLRNASNCSLSTMAPEDTSEYGNSRSGLGRMRNVMSSGSVSTMAADWVDCLSESGEDAEFELNVEEVPFTRQETFAWPDTDSEEEEQWPSVYPRLESAPKRLGVHRTSHTTLEFSHGLVPRNRNWAAMKSQAEKSQPPTTLMIRNIPSKLSQQELVMELKDLGFAGTFDFLYIPMDKNTSANVGYAFVNFVEPASANKCMERFQNHCFTRCRRGSARVASVSVAHLQGLEKNLQHYENSAVNMSKQTKRRPLVLTSIGKIV